MNPTRAARRSTHRLKAWTGAALVAVALAGAPAPAAADEHSGAVGSGTELKLPSWKSEGGGETEDSQGSQAGSPDVASPGKDGELSWAPPELEDPKTIILSSKKRSLKLQKGQDYILEAPKTIEGRVTINGGDDIVWIGGEIDAPGSSRALYLRGSTGVVHVEGIRITGKGLKEGINISTEKAEVRLQNILVDKVNGTRKGHHADVVQTWKGPRKLLIDRLEGTTTYQGFMWDPFQFGEPGSVDLYEVRNTVLRHTGKGGYPIYKSKGDYPVRTSDVVVVSPKASAKKSVVYAKGTPASAWAGVTVAKKAASPLTGEPGIDYTSPGYADSDAKDSDTGDSGTKDSDTGDSGTKDSDTEDSDTES